MNDKLEEQKMEFGPADPNTVVPESNEKEESKKEVKQTRKTKAK